MWMTVSRASAIGMPSKPRWKSDVSKRRKGNLSYFIGQFESGRGRRVFAVPYEWYRRSKIAACQRPSVVEGEAQDQQVLVLWVAADEFGPSILQRIGELLSKVQDNSTVTAKIIGPRSSSEFRQILKEIEEKGQPRQERAGVKAASFSWENTGGRIEIYSPWATAMPGLLAYRLKSPTQSGGVECRSYLACSRMFNRLLSDAGLELRYHIDSDEALFESLFHELNRRQVTVGEDSIVLIGEWDSFYARALPLTFSAVACKYIANRNIEKAHPPSDDLTRQLVGKCATTEDGIDQMKAGVVLPQALHIRQYSYLSGLDGEVLEDRASKLMPKKVDKEKDDGGKENSAILPLMKSLKGPRSLIIFGDSSHASNPKSRTRRSRQSEFWGQTCTMRFSFFRLCASNFPPSSFSRPIWTRVILMKVNESGLAMSLSFRTSACRWRLNFNRASHRFERVIKPLRSSPS